MASFTALRSAVVAHLQAGYTARTVYADPPGDELTAADELAGWVEIAWRSADEGAVGGRLGPTQTYYLTEVEITLRILIPRGMAGGQAAAWAAAWVAVDALRDLMLEAQVGDLYVHAVEPRPYEIEDGDSHVQIDLTCTGSFESVK